MEYPDRWVFDFDQETLTNDFGTAAFIDFVSMGDSSVAVLKARSLSFNEYESEVQKVLINQNQLLFSFFNTEALCNDHKYFQYFSSKVVKYVESEVVYANAFWKYGAIKDFVRHRVNASLLRTLKFLTTLQITVLEKYNNGKDLSNLSIIDPEQDSLMENVEDLLVDYQQLNTMIIYFRKAYGELLNKVQNKVKYYQAEIDLIGKIFLFCKTFFIANPRAIWKVINKNVPEEAEKEILMRVLKANEVLNIEIYERGQKKPTMENEKKGIEDYILLHFSNTSLKKFLHDIDQEPTYNFYDTYSPNRTREGSMIHEPLFRKRETLERLNNDAVYIPLVRSDEAVKEDIKGDIKDDYILKEEISMQEIEVKKERKDLLTLLGNSPNSPVRSSKFVPVDARISQVDYQMSKSAKSPEKLASNSRTTSYPEETKLKPILVTAMSEEYEANENYPNPELSHMTSDKPDDMELMDSFLKKTLNEDFLKSMTEQSLEPKKLKHLGEQQPKHRKKSVYGETNTKTFFNRKRGQQKQLTASNILSAAMNREDSPSEDASPLPKQPVIVKEEEKAQLGDFFENVLKEIKETVVDGAFVVSREDKGQDIPDEQLLGNLIRNDNEDYDYEAHVLNANMDDNYEERIMTLAQMRKGDFENSHNKFINCMLQMKEKKQMMSGYAKVPKNRVCLDVKESLDRARRRDLWVRVKDRWRAMQVQSEILSSMEEEDPTYGLDATIRSLEYFGKLHARNKAVMLDFSTLNK